MEQHRRGGEELVGEASTPIVRTSQQPVAGHEWRSPWFPGPATAGSSTSTHDFVVPATEQLATVRPACKEQRREHQ